MLVKNSIRDFAILIALFLTWIFFSIMSPNFLSARNISMLTIEYSITSILALGMFMIILTGNIDLSAGSGVGLLSGIASVLVFNHHWHSFLALPAAFVIGVIIWFLMGKIIADEKVPSFIITLGGLLVFKGFFWLVIQNSTIPVVISGSNLYSLLTTYYLPSVIGYILVFVSAGIMIFVNIRTRFARKKYGLFIDSVEKNFFKNFIQFQVMVLFVVILNQFRGVPLAFCILVGTAVVTYIITQHTRFGRYLYAIGGNEEAAIISGIPVKKVVTFSFAIMGMVVAITGFMQASYAGASTTTTGNLMELDAIAACVIGGTSLKGGRGTIPGVLFGALLMTSLLNGMTLMAVSPEIKFIARGFVLALSVWLDVRLSR
ncbi:D-xylose ABC transporter permease [Candidatus Omnitrophus magneticus]|uniref:Xylose transport system permease protein XylH n=1 Tax=Candidatus Omnitrophus magneticus TaxID=1609969 RepID=A0A0F0CTQ8_9BACT|nr:D-xylose ABC transporter permease [Candidatus Omnitrophus magneticus]